MGHYASKRISRVQKRNQAQLSADHHGKEHECVLHTVKRLTMQQFDRSDDTIFKTNLYKYKRSNWPSMFWQFGLRNPTSFSIPPPTESFPRCSGGFFFTDVDNIVRDPAILQRIADAVEQLNTHPLTLSRWRFVLKHDVFDQLRALSKGAKDTQRIQAAVISLSLFLNQNKCEVMRDWAAEENTAESTAKWAESVARRYHNEYEYFVLVDDIGSMNVHIGCLDQRPSKDLVHLFNVPD
ncbi:hypothetical protein BJV82DRAFT_264462 [Fennellomyces sp. T-0311]|nr:hypothetical protein BJV82DRAFT_264462 [Fennellomyces sp. T-0311]